MTEAEYYQRLRSNISDLNLHGIEVNLDEYIQKIEKKEISVTGALCELTDIEMTLKKERAIHGCVKVANFPYLKTMDDFDFEFQPSINQEEMRGFQRLDFIDKKENILFIGSPGVGKTHLSVSIGIEAAKNRKSTYFVNCNDLLMNLKEAQKENRLEKRLKHYARYKLLIIDEVGFLPLDIEGSRLLFQLISKRYEKSSTIITTNIAVSRWDEVFGDSVMANAILDRLLHHCTIIHITGDSYRLKDKTEELERE